MGSFSCWNRLFTEVSHGDLIATKNNIFYIIDCKTLKNKSKTFSLSRKEENQALAYKRLAEVGSYNYYYAILHDNNVYLVPMVDIIDKEKTINLKSYIIFKRNFYENIDELKSE